MDNQRQGRSSDRPDSEQERYSERGHPLEQIASSTGSDRPDPTLRDKAAARRFEIPLPHVFWGMLLLALILIIQPAIPMEFKGRGAGGLVAGSIALVAGGAWRNRDRGLVTGLVLSALLAGSVWFYVSILSWSIIARIAVPVFGILLLAPLPALLGYIGGRFTEEMSPREKETQRRREPFWNAAVLVICSISILSVVGLEGHGFGSAYESSQTKFRESIAETTAKMLPPENGVLNAKFQNLGDLPQPQNVGDTMNVFETLHLSPDGNSLVGRVYVNEGSTYNGRRKPDTFLWTQQNGFVDLNATYPELRGVSAIKGLAQAGDTLIVSLLGYDTIWKKQGGLQTDFINSAVRWATQKKLLGPGATEPEKSLHIYAISSSGDCIVFTLYKSKIRWTATGGFETLDTMDQATILGITDHGTALAGYTPDDSGAFIWSKGHGTQTIPRMTGTGGNAAYAITPDGNTTVGESGQYLFCWKNGGSLENLGRLPGDSAIIEPIYRNVQSGGIEIEPFWYTISDDGRVVVGKHIQIPFLWTAQSGIVSLGEVLASCGADVISMPIITAAVSPDGHSITGISYDGNIKLTRWRLTLP